MVLIVLVSLSVVSNRRYPHVEPDLPWLGFDAPAAVRKG